MERDYRCGVYFAHYINFNSHAHVERDEIIMTFFAYKFISTHTLTWSVT